MADLHPCGAGRQQVNNCKGMDATPAKMSLGNMTFGIELEFVVVSPDGCFNRLELDGVSNAVKALDRLLNTRGIASKCTYRNSAPRFSR